MGDQRKLGGEVGNRELGKLTYLIEEWLVDRSSRLILRDLDMRVFATSDVTIARTVNVAHETVRSMSDRHLWERWPANVVYIVVREASVPICVAA